MVPCKNCIVLAICQGIITDGKKRLSIYHSVGRYVDEHIKLPMKFKSLLTQDGINILVDSLVGRCSILEAYLSNEVELEDEHYWNVRHFFNLNQGEYSDDDITVV